jgi:hypothetical protein
MAIFHTNNTPPRGSRFPLDDADGTWMEVAQKVKLVAFSTALVVVITLLTCAIMTLCENRTEIRPEATKGNWIKIILTSKMAVPCIICAHLLATAAAISGFLLANYAPTQLLCTFSHQMIGISYVFALWTTYVLFVARGFAMHGPPLEGWKHWVTFAVHLGTGCMPVFFALAVYAGSGTFYQGVCVQNVVAVITFCIMIADSLLSTVS